MKAATRLSTGAIVVCGADLVWVLLTRGGLLGFGPVGRLGLALRLLLLAILLVVRLAVVLPRERRLSVARLSLIGFLLATLHHFHFVGPRVVGDGMMYYVYVRSLWKDLDVDFANEYEHYGLLRPDRGDLITPTKTGLRRSIFSIGPAVMWSPFFLGGEAVARIERLRDARVDLSGYGPIHWNAVALGSLLYGFAAIWLIHAFVRRHFGESIAFLTALLTWLGTFLYWYMVHQPTYAHAASAFLVAVAVWLGDRNREGRGALGSLVLGLVIGLAMCVRWQNGVVLLLPAFEILSRWWRDRSALPRLALSLVWLGAGVVVGVLPQLAAWKALYDEWLLRYPPHGAGFVRLDHPFFLETLFSSRHGLLSWTPVLWLGYLGFVPALRKRLGTALPLFVPLVVMTYVNVCAGDWWAGASFSNRRFDGCLPLLAFGLAAGLESLRNFGARRPAVLLTLLVLPLVGWNLGLAASGGPVDRRQPEPFARIVRRLAAAGFERSGSPMTWPASWVFALRHDRPAGQYDRLVGRYLFYRQNNLGGRIDLGAPGDESLLGEGWSGPDLREGVTSRTASGRARLFAPLDVPERLALRVRARVRTGDAEVGVSVNGRPAGAFIAGSSWQAHEIDVAASWWHREINEVALDMGAASLEVDMVEFIRSQEP